MKTDPNQTTEPDWIANHPLRKEVDGIRLAVARQRGIDAIYDEFDGNARAMAREIYMLRGLKP